jgi:lipoprotein signal peptidase
MTYPNRKSYWYSVAFIVLAIDQATKSLIDLTTPLAGHLK